MLNHFRTLLLNLNHVGDNTEHIPINYLSLDLPKELIKVYDVLFPKGISRLYKIFLIQNYLNIIKAADLEAEILKFDSRISYSNDPNFFKINRITNPIVSNERHPIFIYGKYVANSINQNYYDNFLISQIDDTQKINIYSKVKKVYINNGKTYTEPTDETEILLDFTDINVSKPIPIGSTGISFAIGNKPEFFDTSNKTWEFIVESPYIFEFNKIFESLLNTEITDSLFNYRTDIDVTKYENYWKFHYNPVYRISGLLLALAKKINTLL